MYFSELFLEAADIASVQHFYTEVLGLQLLAAESDRFMAQAGRTTLRFRESAQAKPVHFAFNIPSTAIEAARDWLSSRVKLLPRGEDEIIEFPNWQARALYFHDPAGNIVEFIAREAIAWEWEGSFSSAAIGDVSEVGLVVHDPAATVAQLQKLAGLPVYWESGSDFTALGNPEALFIIVPAGRWTWTPTDEPAELAVVTASFRLADDMTRFIVLRDGQIVFRGHPV
jgi:catechol 2,3-dioxygenase-like lactoylglutathione lyase family enzyme